MTDLFSASTGGDCSLTMQTMPVRSRESTGLKISNLCCFSMLGYLCGSFTQFSFCIFVVCLISCALFGLEPHCTQLLPNVYPFLAAKKMVFHIFPDYRIYRSWLPFSLVGVIGDASGSLHPHLHSYFSTISFQQHAGFRLDLAILFSEKRQTTIPNEKKRVQQYIFQE